MTMNSLINLKIILSVANGICLLWFFIKCSA